MKQHKIGRFLVLWLFVLCLSLLGGCGGGDKTISGSVRVMDNELTDLTRAELREYVENIVGQNPLSGEIKVVFLSNEYTLPLDAISAEYDVEAITNTAFDAGTQSIFGKLFGGKETVDVPLAIKYDESELNIKSAEAALELSRNASDFSYEIGENGITVTKGGTAAYLSADQIIEALETKLAALDFTELHIDANNEYNEIDFTALKDELDREAKSPTLDLETAPDGSVVLEGERGIKADIATMKRAYDESGDSDTFFFEVEFTEPTISMSDFQNKLFADTLSTKTTSFNASLIGRTTNVKLACDFTNNIILNPGDEYSYNKSVGPRTYERGFKDATVYVAGTTEDGVGGGICQVSSTIYSAVLHADLEISERHNHSYMVTYVPFGEDATVVYGSKDFKFVNNTDYPIKLRVTYGKSTMTVSIIGTKTSDKKVEMSTKKLSSTPFKVVYKTDPSFPIDTTSVKNNGYTGYVTETYRLVYENGVLVSNTFENKSVYKVLDKLILENPSSPEKSGNYVPTDAPVDPTPPDGGQTPPPDDGAPTDPDPENPDPQTPPDDGGEVTPPDPENPIDGTGNDPDDTGDIDNP